MKRTARVVGSMLMLVGVVWILQGVNVLPGSFMTGQIEWAVYGAISLAAGIALWILARGRQQKGSK